MKITLGFFCIMFPTITMANLNIVATESTYMNFSNQKLSKKIKESKDAVREEQPRLGAGITISSSNMTEGKVAKSDHPNLSGVPAFFIVGTDRVSQQWLKKNRTELVKLHAIGFVVGATAEQTRHLSAKFNLPLLIGNTNSLSTIIGTDHYPVLVAGGQISRRSEP